MRRLWCVLVFSSLLGLAAVLGSMYMRTIWVAKITWRTETIEKEQQQVDTRPRRAGIGAVVGGAVGGILYAIIGTIGIATGGGAIAVGLPVYLAVGSGLGALGGAATGTRETTTTTEQVLKPSVEYVRRFSDQQADSVAALGVLLLLIGVALFVYLLWKGGGTQATPDASEREPGQQVQGLEP